MIRVCLRILGVFALLTSNISYSWGQTYLSNFSQVLVTNGISNPTAMAFAPDGRIFVAQQAGSLRVIKAGVLLPTPFITLTVNSTGERGLIGIALDPNFSSNNFVYLYYTVPGSPAHNRISRFTANGDVAGTGTEVILLELDPLSGATNHNGGAMHFGKDGKLYVAVGENANSTQAQNLDTYHGKLLRINNDGSVPGGNPFTTGSEQRKRVWAYGLRNPYTFSIHPVTGRILVNDVGQNTWEEINDATDAGKNFGWPTTEGFFNATTYPAFSNPIYSYKHGSGDGLGCAITGGTFFHPSNTNYPEEFYDRYFFQDLCNSWINNIVPSAASPGKNSFATGIPGNSLSLTTGIDGNLYFLSRTAGALYKITYNATTLPFITVHPANVSIAEGQTATFNVAASGGAPLIYQWQKDGVAIAGATASTYIVNNATSSDDGNYSVVISNSSGTAVSNTAALTVIQNSLPVAAITSPLNGSYYVAGTSVSFSGTGTDAEDGELGPSNMSWNIDFHHDTHKHDEPSRLGISSGTFEIPREGETSDNVWYRISLTVTDSKGMSHKDSVDILPRKTTITFITSPPGLAITLDGQPLETPASVTAVEGTLRSIGIISPQIVDDAEYSFQSWSNQGESIQTITIPTDDVTLTAQYSIVVGIEKNSSAEVTVFPNPSPDGQVTVRIVSGQAYQSNIRIVDPLSREVFAMPAMINAGENDFLLSHPKFLNGMYLLLIEFNGRTVSRKLIVH